MMVQTVGGVSVSRETFAKLEAYAALLKKWNRKINLVGPATIQTLWERHIVDSAQVFHVKHPESGLWLDIGSGAGLPGMICAILAQEKSPDLRFAMIESDQRKAAFLRTANRECGLSVEIIAKRIEEVAPMNADILSARALADLSDLLSFADHHLAKTGTALFPKGAQWKKEVDNAEAQWRFTLNHHKSVTNDDSTILEIGGIARV
jgi:16S rRNA (guanine527-N7)-methyltransferase